jgi:hypothetical protein
MADPPKRGKPPGDTRKSKSKGLVPPRHAPAAPRPARPGDAAPPPVPPRRATDGAAAEPISIESHRALLGKQRELIARLNADPERSVLFLLNPVLAFQEIGVTLSRDVAHHVLHRLQHPVALRERRDALEAALTERLGEPPRPTDPAWVSRLLFETLKLEPHDTAGQSPVYQPPLNASFIAALQTIRPAQTQRYTARPRRLLRRAKLSVAPWSPTVRRMDLAAPVPDLPRIGRAPDAVSLEELWFYKDRDEVARQALELGILQRQSFPFQTPDAFRRIRDGEKRNAFRAWIRSVRFPERRR